ncbi:MAG: peptidoglycan-binding protein [Chitinophagaceae bacterium]|nr:peptidoglycan-binding protein [Rubrivivax sp.]
MSDEHDSWFKEAFGVDLGQSVQKIQDEGSALIDDAKSKVSQVVEGVRGKVEETLDPALRGISGAVKKVAGAVGSLGAAAAGGPPVPAGAGQAAGSGGEAGSFPLSGSVGRGGKNAANDVRAVQAALGIPTDGQCGPQTIAAIEAFQRNNGQTKADGRVDAGGATERAMAGGSQPAPTLPSAGEGPIDPNEDDGSLIDRALKGVGDLAQNVQNLGEQIIDRAGDVLPNLDLREDLPASNAGDERTPGTVDRIIAKMKAGEDLRFDFAMLKNMDMRDLLDVMQALKKAGKLEDFADRATSDQTRIGVAILTTRPELDALWRKLVAGLNDADRKAVLERVPKNVRTQVDPAAPSSEDGDDDEGPTGDVTVDFEGIQVEAKLAFESKAFGSLGTTEFAVQLGPDGTLGAFEVDMTLVSGKLKKLGKLGPVLDLQGKLSLNAGAELSQRDTQVIFDGVQAGVKGEAALRFKQIPVLRKVLFKMTVTAGSGGTSISGGIEIPIPSL